MNERGGTSVAVLEVSASDVENTTPNSTGTDLLNPNPEKKDEDAKSCQTMAKIACGACPLALFCLDKSGNPKKEVGEEVSESEPDKEPEEEPQSYLQRLLSEKKCDDIVVAVSSRPPVRKQTENKKTNANISKVATIETDQPNPQTPQSQMANPVVTAVTKATSEANQNNTAEVVAEAQPGPLAGGQESKALDSAEQIESSKVTANRPPEIRVAQVKPIESAEPIKPAATTVQQPQPITPSKAAIESVRPETIEVANYHPSQSEAYSVSIAVSSSELVENNSTPTITQIETVETETAEEAKISFSIEDKQVQTELAPASTEQVSKPTESVSVSFKQASVSDVFAPASIEQTPLNTVAEEAETIGRPSNASESILVENDAAMHGHLASESETEVWAESELKVEFVEPRKMKISSDLFVNRFEPSEQIVKTVDTLTLEGSPEKVLIPTYTAGEVASTPYVANDTLDVAPTPHLVPTLDVAVGPGFDSEEAGFNWQSELSKEASEAPIDLIEGAGIYIRRPEIEIDKPISETENLHEADDEVADYSYSKHLHDSPDDVVVVRTSRGSSSLPSGLGTIRQMMSIGVLAVFMALRTKTKTPLRVGG